ncbi:MoaD/ThiS family protein [[Actinomadura] parvosata]|uniref:MoaD/ThiS family protein n=1 Tax=[Actinomadura] parvosata TaxID=1955412 RepID=UPI001E2C4D0C|nr:MoaD/ThiS family protein [Nonomuraea sp. ATCC 55076]
MLPTHLRRLASVNGEVTLQFDGEEGATQRLLLDALEASYPMLRGTIRDQSTGRRRALVKFFACGEDVSFDPPDSPLPSMIRTGVEPFLIVGAMAGG